MKSGFFEKSENLRTYLCPGNEMPEQYTKTKHFIPKVMLLCAVARPQYDYNGKSYFDEKIRLRSFLTWYQHEDALAIFPLVL